MARRPRKGFEAFSLSFLDAMSCGLGAVILIFMIINHASEVESVGSDRDIDAQLSMLESEVLEKRSAEESLAAAIKEKEEKIAAAQKQATALQEIIDREDDSDQEVQVEQDRIAALKRQIEALEKQVETMSEETGEGDATRTFTGDGNRQYLTGISVGGKHILILLDSSASMLGDTIIDIIRRRNMSESRIKASPKWQRGVNVVDWISTQIPVDSKFQLYTFNTDVSAAIKGSKGKWQSAEGGKKLNEAIAAVRKILPKNGTSLENAFVSISALSPKPDNIFLITDGLPTQDSSGTVTGKVSGRKRLNFYSKAVRKLPRGIPVNVILLPMEGDPMATSAFWQMAQYTGGSFLSPSEDWP